LNNKFINGIKAGIGYKLDSAGASSSAVGTFAGAGIISIRHETVMRHKKKQENIHSGAVGSFVLEH
ncbi:3967_t:CDS:1, partial [Entrophospora sp. SA101]